MNAFFYARGTHIQPIRSAIATGEELNTNPRLRDPCYIYATARPITPMTIIWEYKSLHELEIPYVYENPCFLSSPTMKLLPVVLGLLRRDQVDELYPSVGSKRDQA